MQRTQRRQRTRLPMSRRRRVLLALSVAVLLDLVLCGLAAAAGGYELLAAQRGLRGAPSGSGLTVAQGRALRDRLDKAGLAFGVARACWWPWRPLAGLVAAAVGPAVGPARGLGDIGPLLDLASDGTTAGTSALDGAIPLLAALGHGHTRGAGDAGTRVLRGLLQGHGALGASLADLERVQSDWRGLDTGALPAALRTRLAPAGHLVPSADDAVRAALSAPDLLGETRPRTYLLVPENSWDLRATGGFAGTAALLRVDHGRLQLTSLPSEAVDIGRQHLYIPPPLPLLTYEHFSNWLYRDANWSPNFPTSAALLRYFYWLGQGHGRVSSAPDGVIAFDSSLLAPLLDLTGAVRVPSGATTITLTAANAVRTLDRYVNSTGTVNKDVARQAYGEVFRRLTALPSSRLPAALRVLGAALLARHLLLWLPDPAIAPILARHGWDGAVDQTRADYLYVVDTNVHYNKINNRVYESLAYRAVVQADRSLRSTLTITYTNTAVLKDLPKPQNNTLYEDFVRVHVPLGSRLLATSGLTEQWNTTRAYNKTVFAGYLRVPSLAHRTVTFSYRVPPNALLDPTTYRLTVQKQPGISDTVPVRVDLATGAPAIRVGGGVQWSWQGRLGADQRLTAPLAGGTARPEPLVYDVATATVAPGGQIDAWTALPAGLPLLR